MTNPEKVRETGETHAFRVSPFLTGRKTVRKGLKSILIATFVLAAGRFVALPTWEGGKSGQRRAPYFLTGSRSRGQASVTENNRHGPAGVRVKR
jgi:hypothetical protein